MIKITSVMVMTVIIRIVNHMLAAFRVSSTVVDISVVFEVTWTITELITSICCSC